MKPRRVLHVIRPAEGGMKGHLLTLTAGLKNSGYEIEVACPEESSLAREIQAQGLAVHYINLVGPLSPVGDYRCIIQLHKILQRGKYDIVHFHGAKAGLVGRIAALAAGCPGTVLTTHNFIIYDEVPLVKKILFRYGEMLLSRVTTRIITVSKALKTDLIHNYRINSNLIIPVYNGIDTTKYMLPRDDHAIKAGGGFGQAKYVVGTVARMAPQKGLQYLLEAMALINRLDPARAGEIVCVVAGDGPLRAGLEKLAGELGLGIQVIFPGFIDDVPGFLACLDVFVVPSIAEGLSITTIEAMAAGLPVVASRVGGLPELVTEGVTGYLVEPRNPRDLADAVLRVLGQPEQAKSMGEKAREMACQRFSIEAMVNDTCQVYDQVLSSGARGRTPMRKGLRS